MVARMFALALVLVATTPSFAASGQHVDGAVLKDLMGKDVRSVWVETNGGAASAPSPSFVAREAGVDYALYSTNLIAERQYGCSIEYLIPKIAINASFNGARRGLGTLVFRNGRLASLVWTNLVTEVGPAFAFPDIRDFKRPRKDAFVERIGDLPLQTGAGRALENLKTSIPAQTRVNVGM